MYPSKKTKKRELEKSKSKISTARRESRRDFRSVHTPP
jgi:hypothetical protein